MNLIRMILLAVVVFVVAQLVRGGLAALAARRKGQRTSAPEDTSEALTECPVCKEYVAAASKACGRPACPRLVLAALIFVAALFGAGSAQADDGGRYLMEISGANVSSALEINGIKVGQWKFEQAASAGLSFNHWLRTGANTIRLTASAGAGTGATMQARVYFLGLTSAGGMNAVNLINITKLEEVGSGKSVSFNVPTAPALALWQAAPAQLNDAAKTSIRSALVDLHRDMLSTLQKGGGFTDLAALAPEFKDMASAYGGGNAAATSRGLVPGSELPQDKLESAGVPDLTDLEMAPLADGRVVRVSRRAAGPLIGVRGGGREMVVSALLFGYVDGAWRILRRVE